MEANPEVIRGADYSTYDVKKKYTLEDGIEVFETTAGTYWTTHPNVAQLVVPIVRAADGVIESTEKLAENVHAAITKLLDAIEPHGDLHYHLDDPPGVPPVGEVTTPATIDPEAVKAGLMEFATENHVNGIPEFAADVPTENGGATFDTDQPIVFTPATEEETAA